MFKRHIEEVRAINPAVRATEFLIVLTLFNILLLAFGVASLIPSSVAYITDGFWTNSFCGLYTHFAPAYPTAFCGAIRGPSGVLEMLWTAAAWRSIAFLAIILAILLSIVGCLLAVAYVVIFSLYQRLLDAIA